jgi:hypothetical protein
MAKNNQKLSQYDPIEGAAFLRQVFPLLARLAPSGTERDKAKNRQLLFSQYAGLILVGLLNPILNSARSLIASSGLKNIRRLTGGKKTSLGSFSEAASVFDPALLEGIIKELRTQWHKKRSLQQLTANGHLGKVPENIVERLVAVDGSVLTALPQLIGKLGDPKKERWRLHAHVRVSDQTPLATTITKESETSGSAERDVMANIIENNEFDVPTAESGHLFLMDRGYRSAVLFNKIHQAGHDYVCRLNRNDGRTLSDPVCNDDGEVVKLPAISEQDSSLGIVADELITLGGKSGASKIGSDHLIRRIILIPTEDRPSSARQGRVRTDQGGRDELILATTLMDLPAEQIVSLYENRWQVELFFRFLKQVLKCDQLLTAQTAGVEIQIYCAIIASLLLALATGGTMTKRNFEMICLYFSGWADEDELLESLGQRPP